jgi:hypothetical protein
MSNIFSVGERGVGKWLGGDTCVALFSGVNGTRATIKVPTHRTTPPPPLRVSGLLKRTYKKATLERLHPVGRDASRPYALLYPLICAIQAFFLCCYLGWRGYIS